MQSRERRPQGDAFHNIAIAFHYTRSCLRIDHLVNYLADKAPDPRIILLNYSTVAAAFFLFIFLRRPLALDLSPVPSIAYSFSALSPRAFGYGHAFRERGK